MDTFVRASKILISIFMSVVAFYMYRNGEHLLICIIIWLMMIGLFLNGLNGGNNEENDE